MKKDEIKRGIFDVIIRKNLIETPMVFEKKRVNLKESEEFYE